MQLHTPIYHRNLPRDLKPNPHPDTTSVLNKQNKSMKMKPRIWAGEYGKKKTLIFRCLAWKGCDGSGQHSISLIQALEVAASTSQHLHVAKNHLLRQSDSSVLSLFQKPLLHLLLGAEESA